MDSKEEMISLKVLVDKKQNRVVFAEADKEFIDILLSFLTFPMGTIVRLLQKQPNPVAIGCMNSLYAGLENLETQYFQSKKHKVCLLHPVNSSGHMCRQLKFNIDDSEPAKYQIDTLGQHFYNIVNDSNITSDPHGAVFVDGNSRFMISDDLKIMHISSSFSFELLNMFGAQDLNALEEKILNFGKPEILSLLKLSWLSKTPLTDLYLMKRPEQSIELTGQFESECLKNPLNYSSELPLKIFLRKSSGKLLYVEAREDFVDYLLSILSIPLGAVVELLDSTPFTCISNLYNSVKEFTANRDIKTESHRAKLISPKIAPQIGYRIQLLGINEFFQPEGAGQIQQVGSKDVSTYDFSKPISAFAGGFGANCSNVFGGAGSNVANAHPVAANGFVKKPTAFMVMDDLSFTPLSPIANLFLLNKLNVRISDIEERAVSFGGEEALRLLEASLTTTSALTYALKLKELQAQPATELRPYANCPTYLWEAHDEPAENENFEAIRAESEQVTQYLPAPPPSPTCYTGQLERLQRIMEARFDMVDRQLAALDQQP